MGNHSLTPPGKQYQHTIALLITPRILHILGVLTFVDCSVIYLFLQLDQIQQKYPLDQGKCQFIILICVVDCCIVSLPVI